MAEAQYRLGKRKGFTTVYREVAQDSRLSLKARGLFLFMQSLPDNWKFNIPGLVKQTGAGVRQIRAALAELENVGYLVRGQERADNGAFAGNTWVLQDEAPAPSLQNVTTANPKTAPSLQNAPTENASADNVTLNNTNQHNTPLTPQGEIAGVCENGNPDSADADADSVADLANAPDADSVSDNAANVNPDDPDAANAVAVAEHPDETRRAVTSKCRRDRSTPKWKPERFERFWQFYSANACGKNRQGAVRAWDRLRADDDLINLMGWALMHQLKSDMWQRGVGVPYASTWLNNRRWEDVLNAAPAKDAQTDVSAYIPDDLIGG